MPLGFRRLILFCLCFWTGVCSTPALADEMAQDRFPFGEALFLRNDSPTHLTFFSTALPDRAKTIPPHRWLWQFHYQDSNNVVEQANVLGDDFVLIDGELQRFELSVKYAFSPRWEFRATLPYLTFGGGYLDGFIDSFEETFDFNPVGAREGRASGQMRYLFRVNGQHLIDETDETIHGLGDIPLQIKYQFRDEPQGLLPRMAVRGMLKIPSATDPLLGTDRLDGGVGLLAEQPVGHRLLLMTHLDVTSAHLPLALKTIDIDPVMVLGSFGFEHFLTDRASWKVLFTIGSNPYPEFHEDITALNRLPTGIGVGWSYRLPSKTRLTLSASENINSAWPDFSWNASLEREF